MTIRTLPLILMAFAAVLIVAAGTRLLAGDSFGCGHYAFGALGVTGLAAALNAHTRLAELTQRVKELERTEA